MLAKIAIGAAAVLLLIPVMLGMGVSAAVDALFGSSSNSTVDCTKPVADIPPEYCLLYVAAAPDCPGLDWTVLAAIGKVETDHGRSPLPGVHDGENHAGAGGPMQFLAPTFNGVIAQHQIPPGGATPPSRYNQHDAIHAAAFYLCDSGVQKDIRKAIFAYNHANWYVDKVLAQAALYRSTPVASGPASQAALVAVAFAQAQLGKPYVWGGDGDAEGGFDCSGLTHAAYQAAGITIPRTAQTQYNAGPLLPPGTRLLPGDLVFFSSRPGKITHVGIVISDTQMINAPYTGAVIRIDPIGRPVGASRPASDPRRFL